MVPITIQSPGCHSALHVGSDLNRLCVRLPHRRHNLGRRMCMSWLHIDRTILRGITGRSAQVRPSHASQSRHALGAEQIEGAASADLDPMLSDLVAFADELNTLQLCEPLKSFHDHIRKLASSFEVDADSSCSEPFHGALAESFAALHAQIIQLAETVRTQLAEVADRLEPAKVLQVDVADLARAAL